jgi:predicted nuclease of predicted toxin-antitoxin system
LLAILPLDENMSPRIVRSLWERDVDAIHVRDRGLLGAADHEIWRFARQEVRTIVTINGKDFRKLAKTLRTIREWSSFQAAGLPMLRLILLCWPWRG